MSFFHPMRTLSFVIVTAFAVGFVASAAYANKVTALAGNHGRADIANACSSSGGSYWSLPNGSYGCNRENCDGEGGKCSVSCKSGTCYGSTPIVAGRRLNPNLMDILNGGLRLHTPQAIQKPKTR